MSASKAKTDAGPSQTPAVELDDPADSEAAERARAVRQAEGAAAAQQEATAEATAEDTGEDAAAPLPPTANAPEPSPAKEPASSETEGAGEAGPAGPATSSESATTEAGVAQPAKRRRAPKLDALLAADVDVAREAIRQIAPEDQIGNHASVQAEDDRVVTHLFESQLPGYQGWQWFAVLARVPRGKVATVSEVGLLPSEGSLLAPEWVPWAKRVRPEEKQQADADRAQAEVDSKQESETSGK